MRTHLLFLTLVFACIQNAAACDNLAAILKKAYPNAVFIPPSGDGTASPEFALSPGMPVRVNIENDVRCRVWPAHPDLTLIGVAISRADHGTDGAEADLDILVADTSTGAVRNRLLEPGMMNSDAYRASFQGFDTAQYTVSEGALIFGVRRRGAAGGWGHGSETEHLVLYALTGARLARIMDDHLVSAKNEESAEFSGTGRKHACGDREEMKAYVKVETAMHRGFRDIAVTESRTKAHCTLTGEDDERWVREQSRKEAHRLVYDGERYVPIKK